MVDYLLWLFLKTFFFNFTRFYLMLILELLCSDLSWLSFFNLFLLGLENMYISFSLISSTEYRNIYV